MVYKYDDPTLNITQDAYSLAIGLRQKAAKRGTTVTKMAESLVPRRFYDVLLGGYKAKKERTVQKLVNIAGICLGLAFELSKEYEEGKTDAD